MYDLISRVLFRMKHALIRLSDRFNRFAMYRVSRNEARNLRKRLIQIRGQKIVDRTLKAKIKQYSRETFGSAAFWQWLALYTEMRGEFIEGWIPDEFYRFDVLPKVNPDKFALLGQAKTIDHKLFPKMTIEPQLMRLKGVFIDKFGNVLHKSQVGEYLAGLNREMVIKPDDGRQGKGIIFLHSKEIRLEALPIEPDLIFQEKVRQHKSLLEVYPYSVNTFRVLTHIVKGGDILVKFVNLKMGRGGNVLDNISCGGIWVHVKLNGEVSSNAYDEFGLEIGETHPDTGYRFSDLKISFIQDILTLCKKAHKSFSYVGLIGWDVYVNENGKPYIVEWNAKNPWFWDVEALFGPLFSKDDLQ